MSCCTMTPPVSSGPEDTDAVVHWYCCSEHVALCGAFIADGPRFTGDRVNCVVCIDLAELPCCSGCTFLAPQRTTP